MILTMFNVKPYRDFLFYILADPLDFVPTKTLIYFCLLMNLPSASTKIEKKPNCWSGSGVLRLVFGDSFLFIPTDLLVYLN